MNQIEELKSLLENLPRSYEDFVDACVFTAEKYDCADKYIQFIKENPDSTPSDVLMFEATEILKLKTK